MNPSPLRYPGGKYKIYKFVSSLIEENKATTYIEPFCGGAGVAIELLLKKKVNRIIINDFDYTIYSFWESILNHTEEFIEKVSETSINIREWERQKKIRNNLDQHSIVDIGFSTFFLNRTNRSGIIDKAGPIGGINQNGTYKIDCRFNKCRLTSQIKEIAKNKNKIQLHNLEALDFIEDIVLKTRNSFVFFDPPYYKKGQGLYTNFYKHEDHVMLSRAILKKMNNRKWIVTYDNMEPIKEMYKKANLLEFGLQYTLQEKRCGKEVMIFSKKIKLPEERLNVTSD